MKRHLCILYSLAGLCCLAQAQYQIVTVSTTGFENSIYPSAISSGHIAAYGSDSGGAAAVYWPNPGAAPIGLNPPQGYAFSVTSSYQAGTFYTPEGYQHAALWTGSPGSLIDLHPQMGNAFNSIVTAPMATLKLAR